MRTEYALSGGERFNRLGARLRLCPATSYVLRLLALAGTASGGQARPLKMFGMTKEKRMTLFSYREKAYRYRSPCHSQTPRVQPYDSKKLPEETCQRQSLYSV